MTTTPCQGDRGLVFIDNVQTYALRPKVVFSVGNGCLRCKGCRDFITHSLSSAQSVLSEESARRVPGLWCSVPLAQADKNEDGHPPQPGVRCGLALVGGKLR